MTEMNLKDKIKAWRFARPDGAAETAGAAEVAGAQVQSPGAVSGEDADKLLCLALDVGEHILRCGGEIQRAENTVQRICRAYGAAHVEVFAITSLLLAAVRMPDGTYSSQLRRIYQSSNNLYRLEQFNGISRRICQEVPDFEEAQRWIAKAKRSKPYPDILVFLGSALAAGACSVFFEGSLRDGLAAALVGMIFAGLESVTAGRINRMAQTVLHSFVAGVLAYLSVTVGIGENIGAVMIGTIMLLIPGLELGNALRDLLGSDLLAGSLRIVQVCLVAIMIAFGYAAALLVMGGIFG